MSESCPLCDYETSSELGVKTHCGRKHTDKENPYKVERCCNQCNDIFYINRTEFERETVTGDFCSSECQGKYERNGEEFNCKNCDSEFHLSESRLERRSGNFCSMECLSEYKTVPKTCEECGESFRIDKSEDKRDVDAGKYCSRKCRFKQGKDSSKCDNCGEKFEHPKCEKNGENSFCTEKCYWEYKFQSGNVRKKSEYEDWREAVKDRDDRTCVDCGTQENLHAHHIVPISEDKEKAFDMSNGVTVCNNCHADRHSERGDKFASLIRNQYRNS